MKEAVVGRRKEENARKATWLALSTPEEERQKRGGKRGAVVLSQSRPRITDNVMQRVLDAGEVARKVL